MENNHGKDSTYAMNRDMTWLKAEQALENALKQNIMIVDGYVLF
jgi:hypothetical protein